MNKNQLSIRHLSVKLDPKLGLQGVHFVGGYRVNLQEQNQNISCKRKFLFQALQDLAIRVLQNRVPPHLHFEKGEEITKKSIWKKVKKHHLDFNLVRDVTRFFQLLLQVFIFPLVVS